MDPKFRKRKGPGNHSPQSFFVNTDSLPQTPRSVWLTDVGVWRLVGDPHCCHRVCWSLSWCEDVSVYGLQCSSQPSGVHPRAVTDPKRSNDPICTQRSGMAGARLAQAPGKAEAARLPAPPAVCRLLGLTSCFYRPLLSPGPQPSSSLAALPRPEGWQAFGRPLPYTCLLQGPSKR